MPRRRAHKQQATPPQATSTSAQDVSPQWFAFPASNLQPGRAVAGPLPTGSGQFTATFVAQAWGNQMTELDRRGIAEAIYRHCMPWEARALQREAHIEDFGLRSSAFLGEFAINSFARVADLAEENHRLMIDLRELSSRVAALEADSLVTKVALRRHGLYCNSLSPSPSQDATPPQRPSIGRSNEGEGTEGTLSIVEAMGTAWARRSAYSMTSETALPGTDHLVAGPSGLWSPALLSSQASGCTSPVPDAAHLPPGAALAHSFMGGVWQQPPP